MWPGPGGEKNPSLTWESSLRLMPTHTEGIRYHLEDGSINRKYLNKYKGDKTMPGNKKTMEGPCDHSK